MTEVLKFKDFTSDDVFLKSSPLTSEEKGMVMKSYEESGTFLRLDDIVPYDNNPRLNEDAVDGVARSIRNYGFQQTIVVDKDYTIIVGHTRRLACIKLGLAIVPVAIARCLSPEQVKAYRLDDNKTAELSNWDFAKLKDEIDDLSNIDYDLDSLAFGKAELERILGEDDEEDDVGDEKDEEPNGIEMPEPSFVVMVECLDEADQERTFNALKQEGYKCRLSTL